MSTLKPISTAYGGLLARLDILVNLVADRRGLALDHEGRLAGGEARLVADALELDGSPGPLTRDLAAVELLRGLAEAIGLLRDRGDRVETTTLCHPWAQLDLELRAGLVYAAWCHRVPWVEMLHDGPRPAVRALRDARATVLRLLFDLPIGVEVHLPGFVATVADRVRLPDEEWLIRAIAAVFLDPLVALGAAHIDPPPPRTPTLARFDARAQTVIGSALIAAGEDVPLKGAPMN